MSLVTNQVVAGNLEKRFWAFFLHKWASGSFLMRVRDLIYFYFFFRHVNRGPVGTESKDCLSDKVGRRWQILLRFLHSPLGYRHSIYIRTVQVNLCQNLLFLHQLTHNMTKDFSLIYQFLHENYKLRTCCVHILFFRFCFDIQNNLCTQHVLSL